MNISPEIQQAFTRTGCEVAFDSLTRQLYATDASLYQVPPSAVAFPRDAAQAGALIRTAREVGLSVTPRGAGTGLVGGALGEGVVIDFARHTRAITQLDVECQTVRVGAGVVLDQLNAYLKPFGFCFGPDVATSSRATLGGMIANNSSGARAPRYGTTGDHVVSLEVALADGRTTELGPGSSSFEDERRQLAKLVTSYAAEMQDRMPAGLVKRWPGYALDRFGREPANLCHLLAGSEGTLAGILSAKVRLSPLPREKGLGLIFFGSLSAAMQATVEILDLGPVAIEHVDRILLDQTCQQLPFKAARDLLQLDAKPCASLLMVEFYDQVEERLAGLAQRKLGERYLLLQKPCEMDLVWSLRKAGLSLLTGRPGSAKPVTAVEDTAVRPEQLPAYVEGLESIMRPLNLEVCYYGHAASGLLHVRPVLDLHRHEDRLKLRQVADQVSALVRQFRGSLAAEHGVGMARTEYLADHLGPGLLGLMRSVKDTLDPGHLFNPGKIVSDGRYRIDAHLRRDLSTPLQLPLAPRLAFVAKDRSFIGNLEQCNGCGGCRKSAPTMCPTFLATGEELMSTRGRANTIRAFLSHPAELDLGKAELGRALTSCLGCKACTTECPSNVNMALLKAELVHAQQRQQGPALAERLLGSIDLISQFASWAPHLANHLLRNRLVRQWLLRATGISPKRPLPLYAPETFRRWFERRPIRAEAPRGQVILWDDTFVRYQEPGIGRAAVQVLEAAGFAVQILRNRKCCGRPAFSQGRLDRAARLGAHNLRLLQNVAASVPILFLEPSCYSMFVDEYRELSLAGADKEAQRCYLFEEFVADVLAREPGALAFQHVARPIAIHAHCHFKALRDPGFMVRLVQQLPGATAALLPSGCCGMAGAFGVMEAKLELSVQVAAPLVHLLSQQPTDSLVVASGTSCRQQVEYLTGKRSLHMAELLAKALSP